MAIGNELRQSIVQAVQTQAVSQARLAQMLGVSHSSVKRIWQRWRQAGSAQLRPFAGGQRPKLTDQQSEQVRQFVRADTDATLREVQRWLETTHTLRLSLPALSRLLAKLDLPRKKSHSMRRNATQP
ncbi:MAG: transposase [Acidobacteriaceae bacterium]|nr:transposase [Acidobacteriaceae bacterium]